MQELVDYGTVLFTKTGPRNVSDNYHLPSPPPILDMSPLQAAFHLHSVACSMWLPRTSPLRTRSPEILAIFHHSTRHGNTKRGPSGSLLYTLIPCPTKTSSAMFRRTVFLTPLPPGTRRYNAAEANIWVKEA